jgi:hypothetical protein
LNPVTSTQNRTVVDNLLRELPMDQNICPVDTVNATVNNWVGTTPQNQFFRPYYHERLVAALVANGISHSAGVTEQWTGSGPDSTWTTTVTNSSDETLTVLTSSHPPGVVLAIHGSLPGYAWNLDGVLIRLAIAILCLYCVYTIAYALYTLASRTHSRSWGKMSELIALALNSRPSPLLKNASAGIDHTITFQKLVTVKEAEVDGRVELLFARDEADRGPYKRIVRGKKY